MPWTGIGHRQRPDVQLPGQEAKRNQTREIHVSNGGRGPAGFDPTRHVFCVEQRWDEWPTRQDDRARRATWLGAWDGCRRIAGRSPSSGVDRVGLSGRRSAAVIIARHHLPAPASVHLHGPHRACSSLRLLLISVILFSGGTMGLKLAASNLGRSRVCGLVIRLVYHLCCVPRTGGSSGACINCRLRNRIMRR